MSSVDKGTEFELEVAHILRAWGYSVKHNVTMIGKSGAAHQIDVLAEYLCPLHTDTIIVEAKNYGSNVSKDTVMKLVSIQQDLAVGNAILATTSDFTIGARQTAAQYKNLNLWSGSKIMEMLPTEDVQATVESVGGSKFIRAAGSKQVVEHEASAHARKRSSGGWFSHNTHEETVHDVLELSYPYYEVLVKTRVHQKERRGLFSKETVTRTIRHAVAVDGVTGELVDFGSAASYEYAYLRQLASDDIAVLASCSSAGKLKRQNAVVTGLPANKVKTILTRLEAIGLIRRVNNRPVTYKIAVPFPHRPDDVAGPTERHANSITDDDPGYAKVETVISPHEIEEILGEFWGECAVESTTLLWYPYYKVTYMRSDRSMSVSVLDGMTGERQPHLEKSTHMHD